MTGKQFADICNGAAATLTALANQDATSGDDDISFDKSAETETLKVLLAPVNAILDMKAS